jgi:hypothetical protein
MNDEQKDALVALFWIGRGDAEPEEWEATKALARQQHDRPQENQGATHLEPGHGPPGLVAPSRWRSDLGLGRWTAKI